MAYDFHYTPTGTGVISGKEVLEQTEDAINDLGNTAISGVQEALDKAEQALTNSENAVDDAQTALNTANNAEGVAIQAQTDVGNLSGTVTNIGNRMTTAEGNITNLQGRMTTAEGNIGNLQGRMTTAETNIGNLQTAVSTAQATANSAQQTATTARQQSYVFRYSSTAVVPNSTVAYSTIDNTDNIKTGDKILDVDGKLFEITAVDTTNQTVTVGTALIDLALDANVVHTSRNETISGDKVFNNRLIKNIDVVLGTAPSTGKFSNIEIADNNKATFLQVFGGVYDNGNSYARFFVQNKTADDGSGLSPTGTIRSCGFNINLPASSTSDGQGSITPRANKTTDLGLLNYQWKNVWCEKLFLNGTQLDPSAFVTLSDAQTITGNKVWTGTNTFQQNVTYQKTNFYHQVANPSYILKDTELIKGSLATTHASYPGLWQDNNGNILGYVRFVEYSSGRQTAELKVSNLIKNGALDPTGSEVNCAVNLELQPSGEKSLIPEQNNDINLGTSTNKWKTFNGLTPSSLSLPVIDRTKYVDISGYFTNTGTGETNTYPVTANGWIYLRLSNISGCQAEIYDSSDNRLYAVSSSGGIEQIMIPVVSGGSFKTQWATGSAVTVNIARFIPCQGNV